jgi:hypothetical protein
VNITMNINMTMKLRPLLLSLLFLGPASLSVPAALAAEFEFAGLTRRTTIEQLRQRYPKSSLVGSYMYVAATDSHDHIYGVEVPRPDGTGRLRLSFERPADVPPARTARYPRCDALASALKARYGSPANVEEFSEERARNRRLSWHGPSEILALHCFRVDGKAFLAEALSVERRAP